MNYYYREPFPIVRKSVRKTYRPLLKVLRDEPLPDRLRSYERRFYRHREPLPLRVGGTNKLVAYACGSCGNVHSKKYHDRNGQDSAYRAALECCRHPGWCSKCGTETARKDYGKCSECQRKESYIRDRNLARKATRIEDDGMPVWCHWSSGSWGDGYSQSLDDHLQAWEDEHGEDKLPPPFVFATDGITPQISADHIFEQLCEELHEDVTADDLPWSDTLSLAIDAFNAVQKTSSYQIDSTRVIVIDPERFESYLATDANGLPDINYQSTTGPGGPKKEA